MFSPYKAELTTSLRTVKDWERTTQLFHKIALYSQKCFDDRDPF